MANEFNITKDNKFFMGEDKVLSFTVTDLSGIPLDVSTWALEFVVRKEDKSSDVVIPIKTVSNGGIMITGVFDPDPAINTLRVVIFFPSDDTTNLKPIVYRHSLKRTDDGEENILAYGNFTLLQATAR